MNKTDARQLSEDSLQLLRSQAHRLRLQGRTWGEIASIAGVSLSTMMVWARRYRLGTAEFSADHVASRAIA
jgi:transposase